MLDSLSKGDTIVTASGLHGSVVAVHDATLRLMIAPKVEVTLDKTAIAAKIGPQAAAAPSTSN